MGSKYLSMGKEPSKPLFTLKRLAIGATGLAAIFGYSALFEKVDKPISYEIVQMDPWSKCIKDTAEKALKEKLDFEILADTKCKGLAATPKSTPA